MSSSKLRFLGLPEVKEITGLGKTTIYTISDFPKPIKIHGKGAASQSGVRWVESEILGWMESRIRVRNAQIGGSMNAPIDNIPFTDAEFAALSPTKPKSRFALNAFDADFDKPVAAHLIKDILPATGLAVVSGSFPMLAVLCGCG